jgi:hypothetical protein
LVGARGGSRNQDYSPVWPITEQAFHYATADAARSACHYAKLGRGFGSIFAHRRAHHATLASDISVEEVAPGRKGIFSAIDIPKLFCDTQVL